MADPIRPYEDAYEALEAAMNATGKSRKELAALCYPGRRLETAFSLFSRAMNPENTDVNLTNEQKEIILKNTRADDYIYYLCDKFGFERPEKQKNAIEDELRLSMMSMQKQMLDMMQKLEKIEKEKKAE